ncbi:MAG TPA: DUF2344 domain-containing protein [Clostridiales bacterium]|nr:DUF2344 domain-containing protein [Clostridiales bacterium]
MLRAVRIFYKKLGRLKFVSHLDMNRTMSRLLRLAKLPVWYTEGYNPHPFVSLVLPLSLGFESDYEVMDFRVTDDSISNSEIKSALKAVFPPDLFLLDVEDPVMKASDISFADYEVVFENPDEQLERALDTFLSSPSIVTAKVNKKGERVERNIAPLIHEYRINKDGGLVLFLKLSAGSSANLNPQEILQAFEESTGVKLPYYNIRRLMLYNNSGQKFK